MPATAPVAQEPTPVELAQWQTGRSNARQQYQQQLAKLNYQTQQTNLANDINQRQMAQQNFQNRQSFDDPYIQRGIFNSGIRQGGLSNLYQQQANAQATAQQQYLAAIGGYNLEGQQAAETMGSTLSNIDAMELARRAQLAAEIKGIV